MRAVISDLDGTLVDTRAANEAAYIEAFAAMGVDVTPAGYRAAFGLRFGELAAVLAPGLSSEDLRAVQDRKARIYPSYFHLLRRNEGLIALLETLGDRGFPIALATTASRINVEAVLEAVGIADLFEVVVTGEDVLRGKPAPDCYRQAAERLGWSPERCLAVEDSAVGIAAAEAAGCAVLEVAL